MERVNAERSIKTHSRVIIRIGVGIPRLLQCADQDLFKPDPLIVTLAFTDR